MIRLKKIVVFRYILFNKKKNEFQSVIQIYLIDSNSFREKLFKFTFPIFFFFVLEWNFLQTTQPEKWNVNFS